MEHHLTDTEYHLPCEITVLPFSRCKWTHPAYRRDGRLSWPRWLVTYRDGLPTHRSTNRAQCRLTTLIEANALTTTLRHHPWQKFVNCGGIWHVLMTVKSAYHVLLFSDNIWTSILVFVYRRGHCKLGEIDAVNRQSVAVWCKSAVALWTAVGSKQCNGVIWILYQSGFLW